MRLANFTFQNTAYFINLLEGRLMLTTSQYAVGHSLTIFPLLVREVAYESAIRALIDAKMSLVPAGDEYKERAEISEAKLESLRDVLRDIMGIES